MAAAANYYLRAVSSLHLKIRKGSFFSGRCLEEGCAAETGHLCLHVAAKANMGPSEGEHYVSCPSRTCTFTKPQTNTLHLQRKPN